MLSALLFGFLHVLLSLFQQSFGATLLGLVIGLIAVKTRSLWPGVLFHFINNALGVLTVDGARSIRGWRPCRAGCSATRPRALPAGRGGRLGP